MPELRKDPIVGRWVIIATERAKRPQGIRTERPAKSHDDLCPFCPGNEDKTPSPVLVKNGGNGWTLRTVPNKFPALKIEGEIGRRGEGLYDKMNGVGAHEVIIETPAHDLGLADLEHSAVETLLATVRERLCDLQRDTRFRYGMVFKNHGAAAGATLEHSHTQLIALPVVPISVADELAGARRYYDFKERCVFCDIVRQDTREGSRIIFENDEFVALAPYAPKFPFETWILPKRHAAAFERSPDDLVGKLAGVLKIALRKLNVALEDPPYNFILHTAPFGGADLPDYHWHVEIMPTLTRVAGFEWGSGFYINPTPPEEAAAFLRNLPT